MENTDVKRLFLGFALNDVWIDYIKQFIELNKALKIKWIPSQNWHITVLFMGNVPSEIISALETNLNKVFSQNITFYIDFEKFTYAPSLQKPRMIWAKGKKQMLSVIFAVRRWVR